MKSIRDVDNVNNQPRTYGCDLGSRQSTANGRCSMAIGAHKHEQWEKRSRQRCLVGGVSRHGSRTKDLAPRSYSRNGNVKMTRDPCPAFGSALTKPIFPHIVTAIDPDEWYGSTTAFLRDPCSRTDSGASSPRREARMRGKTEAAARDCKKHRLLPARRPSAGRPRCRRYRPMVPTRICHLAPLRIRPAVEASCLGRDKLLQGRPMATTEHLRLQIIPHGCRACFRGVPSVRSAAKRDLSAAICMPREASCRLCID